MEEGPQLQPWHQAQHQRKETWPRTAGDGEVHRSQGVEATWMRHNTETRRH